MRRIALCTTLLLASLGTATAGDFAERHIFGFSADGSRFAFEEFGVQDGSGFPYSNIYVIDTVKDRWLPNMPIATRIDDETVRLAYARFSAANKAQPFLRGIDQPGNLLASNPITEVGRDPHKVVFKRRPELLLANPDLTLSLEKIPLKAEGAQAEDETFGFRLTLSGPDGETVLHQDKTLPKSRGIPSDYRIADVVMYQPFGEPATLAVLVMVIRRGFEGPDGRFMAVTARLPG